MRVIDRVARPALILSAADDPFVPPHIFDAPAVQEQSAHHDRHHSAGGHCAFVEPTSAELRRQAGYDGYFAERPSSIFLQEHTVRHSMTSCSQSLVATFALRRCPRRPLHAQNAGDRHVGPHHHFARGRDSSRRS